MVVEELIKKLQKLPPQSTVFVLKKFCGGDDITNLVHAEYAKVKGDSIVIF